MMPEVEAADLVGLPNSSVCVKLMAGTVASRPLGAETISPSTRIDATPAGEFCRSSNR
jgi:hypothetical protein